MKSVTEMNVGELMVKINDTARAKGWWDGWDELSEDQKMDKIAGKLLLVHAEVSEAAEELRNVNKTKELGFDLTDIYYKDPTTDEVEGSFYGRTASGPDGDVEVYLRKPEGMVIELVDVVVRVLDMVRQADLPFVQGLFEKLTYNDTRSYRHGGKSF